jgi:predicted Zn-dependent protease
MHELAEERISETENLASVVEEVKKLVNQEFLVNSYKAQKRLEQEAEEAKREEELEKVRINK